MPQTTSRYPTSGVQDSRCPWTTSTGTTTSATPGSGSPSVEWATSASSSGTERLPRRTARHPATAPRSVCRGCDGNSLLGQLVTGPVLTDRNTVVATLILGVQTDRVGDTTAVDAEFGVVDVLQGVSALVIVGVERLV